MDVIGKIKTVDRFDKFKCWYILAVILGMLDVFSRSRIPCPASVSVLMPILVVACVCKTFTLRKSLESDISCHCLIYVFLAYNLIIIIRGAYDSVDYWDYKDVWQKFGSLMIPSVALLGFKPLLYTKINRFIVRWYLLLTLLLCGTVYFTVQGLPMLFLISWILLLRNNKWKLLLVVFLVFAIVGQFGARGWILRVFFAFALAVAYKFRVFLKMYMFKIVFAVFVVTPLIFVGLGYTGQFNVFAMDEYVSSKDEDMTADTRSFLYAKVQEKLDDENSELFGVGAKSEYWAGFNDEIGMQKTLKKHGRSATESGLLNYYLMGGWTSAVLYTLLFWTAAWLAVFRSKSILCKLLGMFVLFRWIISFIDEPQAWYLNYVMLFIAIGMCLSKTFRNMQDKEIVKWIKAI